MKKARRDNWRAFLFDVIQQKKHFIALYHFL